MISRQTKEAILELQKIYPKKRSALIPALHLAQAEIGYLPQDVQEIVAELFGIDLNEVNSIVTFYDMFSEVPTGKHHLHVCKNISCMLRGADGLLEKLKEKLKNAPDGEFTIIASECLSACDRAPMMLADDRVYGPINETDLDKILEEVSKSSGHASPVYFEESDHG